MPVKLTLPKHTIKDLGNKLVISIPRPRHWFLNIYLGIVIILWAAGEVIFLDMLIFDPVEFGKSASFLVILLIFVTALGGYLVYQFIWQLSGKEVIDISTHNIVITHAALGIRSPREFSAEHINDLRMSTTIIDVNNLIFLFYFGSNTIRRNIGSLAFDYGAKTYRFGAGIDEAEAKMIIAEIGNKFPQYIKKIMVEQ